MKASRGQTAALMSRSARGARPRSDGEGPAPPSSPAESRLSWAVPEEPARQPEGCRRRPPPGSSRSAGVWSSIAPWRRGRRAPRPGTAPPWCRSGCRTTHFHVGGLGDLEDRNVEPAGGDHRLRCFDQGRAGALLAAFEPVDSRFDLLEHRVRSVRHDSSSLQDSAINLD